MRPGFPPQFRAAAREKRSGQGGGRLQLSVQIPEQRPGDGFPVEEHCMPVDRDVAEIRKRNLDGLGVPHERQRGGVIVIPPA